MKFFLFLILSALMTGCGIKLTDPSEEKFRYKVWDRENSTYYTDSINVIGNDISFISKRDCSCGDSALYRFTLSPPYQIRDKMLNLIISQDAYSKDNVKKVNTDGSGKEENIPDILK